MDPTAVNILTQIDRVSKVFPSFREEYDLLSEKTHPNADGALFYFSEGNSAYNQNFSNDLHQESAVRSLLWAGGLLAIMDHQMSVIEAEVSRVADALRNELDESWNILKSLGNRQDSTPF